MRKRPCQKCGPAKTISGKKSGPAIAGPAAPPTTALFIAGQKYCRMLQVEHSAILLTFIKLPFVIKIYVLSIFEWSFKTSFTVHVAL